LLVAGRQIEGLAKDFRFAIGGRSHAAVWYEKRCPS
jgi:hypothetical protein